MGRKIGLIACSKSKLGAETPDRLFRAQDIYQGRTFKRAKAEGLKMYGCEDWFILSGKEDYNLLDKDAHIKYYEVDLAKQGKAYKERWARIVVSKLRQKELDLKNDVFYIFGGKSYYEPLIPYLSNCVAFRFKGCKNILLDTPIVYKDGKELRFSNHEF